MDDDPFGLLTDNNDESNDDMYIPMQDTCANDEQIGKKNDDNDKKYIVAMAAKNFSCCQACVANFNLVLISLFFGNFSFAFAKSFFAFDNLPNAIFAAPRR